MAERLVRCPTPACSAAPSAAVLAFLSRVEPPTPCLVMDLDIVAARYQAMREALPSARIYYATKANPAPEVLRLLVALGSGFDVASPAEITACLANGARPERLSYGNTIKKAADIAFAHARGVGLFTTDSIEDLTAIATHAPGSSVLCRIMLDHPGAATPFGRKFGCDADMAADLLRQAVSLGLRPRGVSFHVGSQQTDPTAWHTGISHAAAIGRRLAELGIDLDTINLGGGFPASYRGYAPTLAECARSILESLASHFDRPPRALVEPGRSLVADAGVIRAGVVLVSRKSAADEHRWVYLDVGRYGGLAETENEAIAYRLSTAYDDLSVPSGPVVLAGPTCDGDDVLYQRTTYRLPLRLRAGDHVDILSAGAYTASYASVCFNGFTPLPTYCVGAEVVP